MTTLLPHQSRSLAFRRSLLPSKGRAILVLGVLLGAFLLFEHAAEASALRLSGTATYSRSGVHARYNSVRMSGRFQNRGAGRYWVRGFYQNGRLSHMARSNFDFTGSLSYELWGMIFFRGTRGYILRTRGYRPLQRGWGYRRPTGRGPLRRFNRFLWPTIGAAEWTDDFGWVFRARRNFRRSDLL